ncbi:MAG: hypothetical protein IKE05_03660 [Clostridia bacterium]|nr:hypothetical protein [Clostridia bacterium]
MKKHITKLNSETLLEVSGGMEKTTGRSWAKKMEPIDLESGKPEEKESENKKAESMEEI